MTTLTRCTMPKAADMTKRHAIMVLVALVVALLYPVFAAQDAWGAESGLAAAGSDDLVAQAATKDYYFDYDFEFFGVYDNWKIRVHGATPGSVSYDSDTKVLTLSNSKFFDLEIRDSDVTVKLIGRNVGTGYYAFHTGSGTNVTFTGSGSFEGHIFSQGNLVISGPSITAKSSSSDGNAAGISCGGGNVTLRKGSLTVSATAQGSAYGIACDNLTVSGGKITARSTSRDYYSNAIDCDKLTISGGSISTYAKSTGNGVANGISCNEIAMTGGSITVSAGTLYCTKNVMFSGGSIGIRSASDYLLCAGNFTMSGGSIYGNESTTTVNCQKKLTMRAGKITGGVFCLGNMSLTGGTISCADGVKRTPSLTCRDLTVAGGTIKISNCRGALHCRNMAIKKGSVIVDGQTMESVVASGNLKMTGGVLRVTRSTGNAIRVTGTVSITGGALTAKVKNPFVTLVFESNYGVSSSRTQTTPMQSINAITAKRCSIKPSCIKGLAGGVYANGLTIKSGGNTYETINNGKVFAVKLVKYGNKSSKPVFDEVKFYGYNYRVSGVGTKAFATKSGAKVTSATFKNDVYVIDANAFTGAKSMTNLKLAYDDSDPFTVVKSKGKFKSVKWSSDCIVSKKAFAKCGKGNGKGFAVSFASESSSRSHAKAYRNLFIARGMSKSFKLAG